MSKLSFIILITWISFSPIYSQIQKHYSKLKINIKSKSKVIFAHKNIIIDVVIENTTEQDFKNNIDITVNLPTEMQYVLSSPKGKFFSLNNEYSSSKIHWNIKGIGAKQKTKIHLLGKNIAKGESSPRSIVRVSAKYENTEISDDLALRLKGDFCSGCTPLIEITKSQSTLKRNEEMVYNITITNNRLFKITNIIISNYISPELKITNFQMATEHKRKRNKHGLKLLIKQLEAGENHSYTINCSVIKPGTAQFIVHLKYEQSGNITKISDTTKIE